MKRIEQKSIKFIDQYGLINKGDKVLLAFSGGPDSVFLLSFLLKFKKRFGIKLGIFHLNHKLRGKDSDEDEKFCEKFARKNRIAFHTKKKNIKIFASKNNYSLEEAGRIIRYKELEKAAQINGYNRIATAHNCNDNSETIILNLIKGTGINGISGIPIIRGRIIRPILCITKKEILKYLKDEKIEYRVDQTNFNLDFERNFIRNEIIPKIEKKLNPKMHESIFRSSQLFKSVGVTIDKLSKFSSSELIKVKKDTIEINFNNPLFTNDFILGKTIIDAVFNKYSIKFNFQNIKDILQLANNEAGHFVNLPNELIAFRKRDFLRIAKVRKKKKLNLFELELNKKVKIEDKELRLKEVKKSKINFSQNTNKEYFSGDNIKDKLIVRRWENGDKFFPIGLGGSKKISDYLTDIKAPAFTKKKQLVLLSKGKIIWLLGARLDERFKIKSNTKKVYEICLK